MNDFVHFTVPLFIFVYSLSEDILYDYSIQQMNFRKEIVRNRHKNKSREGGGRLRKKKSKEQTKQLLVLK